MTLARQRFANAFALAAEAGPYAFWPVVPAGLDPQFHVSGNDRDQPFHLIHEHDAVLVHLSGRAAVRFPEGPVRQHALKPGDHVYLPAGLPYQVLTEEPSVQLLMKAEPTEIEAVAFYCDGCGTLLHRVDFDTVAEPPQRSYHRICVAFNDDARLRECASCGSTHPLIDVEAFAWPAIADAVEASADAAAPV